MSVKVEELASAINDAMAEYSDEVTKAMKSAVDEVADMAMQEIKDHVTFSQPTGDYVKAFSLLNVESTRKKQKIWHVKKPHYRLAHLLENGHAVRGGGRSKPFPHIIFGEQLVNRILETKVKEAIESAES